MVAPAQHSTLIGDIEAFRHYLRAERGMADNTVLAYGHDLDRFAEWASQGNLTDHLNPTVRQFSRYLSYLREDGLEPSTVARQLVSLKMFYRYLRLEERGDPSAVEL